MLQDHVATDLATALAALGPSPREAGTVELIVARPAVGERIVVEQASLDLTEGLLGDNWRARGSTATEDGRANPEAQITLTNSRVIQLLAGDRSRWAPAGDQLFVDFDLSFENLPPGQRIAIGTAVLEISAVPHTGCKKFSERFGHQALLFVNSREGRQHRRRGLNAKVVQAGTIGVGDTITKV